VTVNGEVIVWGARHNVATFRKKAKPQLKGKKVKFMIF
jgi:hypothetical protein